MCVCVCLSASVTDAVDYMTIHEEAISCGWWSWRWWWWSWWWLWWWWWPSTSNIYIYIYLLPWGVPDFERRTDQGNVYTRLESTNSVEANATYINSVASDMATTTLDVTLYRQECEPSHKLFLCYLSWKIMHNESCLPIDRIISFSFVARIEKVPKLLFKDLPILDYVYNIYVYISIQVLRLRKIVFSPKPLIPHSKLKMWSQETGCSHRQDWFLLCGFECLILTRMLCPFWRYSHLELVRSDSFFLMFR